jgi:hypothetical protein
MTDDDNQTTIESSGPSPIAEVRGALNGIELGERSVSRVSVTVEYEQETPTTDATADGRGDGGGFRIKPPVHPYGDMGDRELRGFEFPDGDPGRIAANTHQHVVAVVLMEWVKENGGTEGISPKRLSKLDGSPLGKRQAQGATHRLFNSKNLLYRRSDGNGYEYYATEELASEYERLGTYDLDAVEGVN